jgi:cation transport ATPase
MLPSRRPNVVLYGRQALEKIAVAIRIARRTIAIARQNGGLPSRSRWAILILARLGLAGMAWLSSAMWVSWCCGAQRHAYPEKVIIASVVRLSKTLTATQWHSIA